MREYKQRKIGDRELRPESLMMSYGYDPKLSEGAIKPPIFQTSTFVFESAEAGKAFFEVAYGLREKGPDEKLGLIYSRLNNPDLEVLEDRLTLWDGAEAAAAFESGMAAIATCLLTFVRPGDAVVHSEPLYGGSEYLLRVILPEFGIHPVAFPAGVPAREVEAAIKEGANALVDIEGIADILKGMAPSDKPPVVMVDNTFLGPLWQHPLEHGADLVLYSATKFLGGHSDIIAGACLGSAELVGRVKVLRTFMGTMAGPWTGWLLMRSLETLKMRMTAQMKNARYVSDFLSEHPRVRRVYHLDMLDKEDPMYPVFRKQCEAAGSVIALEVEDGEAGAFRFLNALQLAKLAVSLGGTESLAEHPGTMTHADIPPEDQKRMGITPGMVRLSVGVEHYEDILADLEQALAAV